LAAGSLITAVNAAGNVNLNGENLKGLDGFNPYERDIDTTHIDEDGLDVEDIDGTRVDNKVTREYINSNGDKLELTVGVLKQRQTGTSTKRIRLLQKSNQWQRWLLQNRNG
ncbi:MAG: hypothetical protein IJI98_01910, partial [Methanosphaera sp.]|nr:hypothetical protein [Methanosphaera sp.]